jgi:hypothetical protein
VNVLASNKTYNISRQMVIWVRKHAVWFQCFLKSKQSVMLIIIWNILLTFSIKPAFSLQIIHITIPSHVCQKFQNRGLVEVLIALLNTFFFQSHSPFFILGDTPLCDDAFNKIYSLFSIYIL